MSLFRVLGAARDGVLAQSAALATTGQNIANVSTPGYVRRRVVLESTNGQNGVRYSGSQRTFDRFSFEHVIAQQSKFSAAQARSYALTEIETAIAPPNGSIGDEAIQLVQAFNALSAFPVDPSLRAEVIAKTRNLASTVASTAKSLEATAENLLGRTREVVGEINTGLKNIADLNRQIATTLGSGGDASGLRDQRDLLVRDVGERLGARAIEGADGRVTLFGAGATLVEGNNFSALSFDLDDNGAMRFYVSSASKVNITSRIDTGTLGGLREARDVDLAKMREKLDAYAYDVATTFNAVHREGYGLDGSTGLDLFVAPAAKSGAALLMAIDPSIEGQPDRVGAAADPSQLPGGNGVALRLGALGTAPSFGGATLADRFADIAIEIGLRKRDAEAESQLRTDTLAVAEQLADSANGVSIDEEMVELSQFQRAFEASTRVLRTADELLKTLLEMV